MFTCIYFAYIRSFDGEDMPAPPNDPGVDPDDDQDMSDAEDHEAGVDRLGPHGAPVPPFSGHRLDSRLRMELGDQLCGFFVEVGVRPATMRDIQDDGRLVHMLRGMSCDMFTLMWHVVGATNLVHS